MEVTGVITKGGIVTSSFVTSYKVLHSTDGKNFYAVKENGVDKVCGLNSLHANLISLCYYYCKK